MYNVYKLCMVRGGGGGDYYSPFGTLRNLKNFEKHAGLACYIHYYIQVINIRDQLTS